MQAVAGNSYGRLIPGKKNAGGVRYTNKIVASEQKEIKALTDSESRLRFWLRDARWSFELSADCQRGFSLKTKMCPCQTGSKDEQASQRSGSREKQ
jgi:hypothetical protein